ncbi:hypothetical protein D5S17_19300 [Pseudonocardiaceae bacterium YIM PH 21723]|nr:hypothetical protein D5S17_19300 [Pseudonocardiaceae bacterium YIM PH 21723]
MAGNVSSRMATGFVGRTEDIRAVSRLLRSGRLVTLTGPGGVGKTRLSQRVGEDLVDEFPDGVWFVELADLRDPALIAHAVARTLSIHTTAGIDPRSQLINQLTGRTALIILDNCEHLLDGAELFSTELLGRTESVRVLATSRERLRAPGERIWQVRRFATGSEDAVQLFAQRAALDTIDLPQQIKINDICSRLEGLPLAIELAAARWSPNHDLELPGAGDHTLRSAIQWSFDLCSTAEQILWARLAIFSGGFDFQAAEHVCWDGELDRDQIPGLLESLTEKSIVICENQRYRLLDTVRDYGLDQLSVRREHDVLERRHVGYYRRLAEQFEREWFGPSQLWWMSRMREDLANLRSAMDRAFTEPGYQPSERRIPVLLATYWAYGGGMAEGKHWLGQLAEHPETDPEDRAATLAALCRVASMSGDLDTSFPTAARLVELAGTDVNPTLRAHLTTMAGMAYAIGGRFAESGQLLREAAGQLNSLPDPEPQYWTKSAMMLGVQHIIEEKLAEACGIFERAAAYSNQHGETIMLSYVLIQHAKAKLLLGFTEEAATLAADAAHLSLKANDPMQRGMVTEYLALEAVTQGQPARAALLLGTAASIARAYGVTGTNTENLRPESAMLHAEVRAAMKPADFEEAFRTGAMMTSQQAEAYLSGCVQGV